MIRYLVIALGSPEIPATQPDVDNLMDILIRTIPFKVTPLSERVSNKLTTMLIEEQLRPEGRMKHLEP